MSRLTRTTLVLLTATVTVLAEPSFAQAAPAPPQGQQATCSRPASNAEALYVISNQVPGNRRSLAYWWDKTYLTITLEYAPSVEPERVAAVESAIATWQRTVTECLGGAVTLTYVPSAPGTRAATDIVVHLVTSAGGNAFGGRAECNASGCNNVIVGTFPPPGLYSGEVPLWFTEGTALHEIGHALGLGHATNLLESTDLMGYGWVIQRLGRVPDISQCDVDALAYVWSWALEGTDPVKPEALTYDCAHA